jgi:hypothetical protein
MTETEVTIDVLKSASFIAKRRFLTLAANASLTPQDVMRELAETVIPQLEDIALLMDRVEQGVEYAQDEIERIDAGESSGESQLLPEDAAKYTDYLEAIVQQADESMRGLDPSSAEHKAMTMMAARGRELIVFTNDITMVAGDDDEKEEEDEDEDDGEKFGEDPATNGNGNGDAHG